EDMQAPSCLDNSLRHGAALVAQPHETHPQQPVGARGTGGSAHSITAKSSVSRAHASAGGADLATSTKGILGPRIADEGTWIPWFAMPGNGNAPARSCQGLELAETGTNGKSWRRRLTIRIAAKLPAVAASQLAGAYRPK